MNTFRNCKMNMCRYFCRSPKIKITIRNDRNFSIKYHGVRIFEVTYKYQFYRIRCEYIGDKNIGSLTKNRKFRVSLENRFEAKHPV